MLTGYSPGRGKTRKAGKEKGAVCPHPMGAAAGATVGTRCRIQEGGMTAPLVILIKNTGAGYPHAGKKSGKKKAAHTEPLSCLFVYQRVIVSRYVQPFPSCRYGYAGDKYRLPYFADPL